MSLKVRFPLFFFFVPCDCLPYTSSPLSSTTSKLSVSEDSFFFFFLLYCPLYLFLGNARSGALVFLFHRCAERGVKKQKKSKKEGLYRRKQILDSIQVLNSPGRIGGVWGGGHWRFLNANVSEYTV